MKVKIHFSLLLTLMSFMSYAQNVGIGTSSPGAKLDISSSNSGLLIPRIALTGTNDASTISSPVTSTLIYNTATVSGGSAVTPGYYYWSGSAWVRLVDGAAASGVTSVSNTSSVNTLSTTVNGLPGAGVPIVNSISDASSGNTLTTTVNGQASTGVSIVNSISNASSGNTLTTTVNGQTSTGANIITSNGLSLSGTTLTSTVNGQPSTGIDISGVDKNIYNSDGTLTGNRTLTLGSYNLAIMPSTTGRVGINNASPSYTLDVGGDIRAGTSYRTTAGSGNILQVGDDAWIADVNIANTIGIVGQENTTYGGIALGTGGAYLYSNGTTGIGINTSSTGANAALSIANSGATQTLNIMPGYYGSTANTAYTTLDMGGTQNLYVWDNQEISGTLKVDGAITGRTWSASLGAATNYTSTAVGLLSVAATSHGGTFIITGKVLDNITTTSTLNRNYIYLYRSPSATAYNASGAVLLDTWELWQNWGKAVISESGVVTYTETMTAGTTYYYWLVAASESGTRQARIDGTRLIVSEF